MLAHPTESRWRRSAPQERSCRTQSRLPPRAAKCSGVLPGNLQERALGSSQMYDTKLSSKGAIFSHKNTLFDMI
jgi:hypothetical protein